MAANDLCPARLQPFQVDVSPMPREKIRTRGVPEPITEATTVTAIVGVTLPLIKPAEGDTELAAKWSRDWRAAGFSTVIFPPLEKTRLTTASGGTPKYKHFAAVQTARGRHASMRRERN